MSHKKKLDYARMDTLFRGNLPLRDCAQQLGTNATRLKAEWLDRYGIAEYTIRKTRLQRAATTGDANYQTRGKRAGQRHWNTKNLEDRAVCDHPYGYLTQVAPEWFTGGRDSGGRVFQHILVYCEHHGLTQLPEGHVVHHRNEDKRDNRIENLQLMTRAEHARHHRNP